MNPAPASSTSVRAISATIRLFVQRRARTPTAPVRPPSFNTSWTSAFETCRAGASPNRIPVPRLTAAMKKKTVPSMVNWIQDGLPTSWVAWSNSRTPTIDRNSRLRR